MGFRQRHESPQVARDTLSLVCPIFDKPIIDVVTEQGRQDITGKYKQTGPEAEVQSASENVSLLDLKSGV